MFAAGAGERQPLLGDLVAGQQVRVEELLPDEVRGEVDVGLESQSGLHRRRRFHSILVSFFLFITTNTKRSRRVKSVSNKTFASRSPWSPKNGQVSSVGFFVQRLGACYH